MAIETQISDLLKEAMRTKDQRTKDVIAMIKTKHMERRTAPGFKAPLDDALWVDVIGAYQKQLRKTREEYAALGDRGAEMLGQLDFEIGFCAKFLPELAGEAEVRSAVKEALAKMAPVDPKQSGRLMGEIMKANKGKFDPAMVKKIVEEEMARPGASG
jgi:uncharacterized protein YqeY